MNSSILEQILDCAKKLVELNLCELGDSISVKDKDNIYITDSKVKFSELTGNDIITFPNVKDDDGDVALHRVVYSMNRKANCVIIAKPKYSMIVANNARHNWAYSKKAGQIVGGVAKIAPLKDLFDIATAMSCKGGCLAADTGVIAVGKDTKEALDVIIALEENSKADIIATLGGSYKKLNVFCGDFLRVGYCLKGKYLPNDTPIEEKQIVAQYEKATASSYDEKGLIEYYSHTKKTK